MRFADLSIHWLCKCDEEFTGTCDLVFIIRANGSYFVLLAHEFHRVRLDKLHIIAYISPLEAPCLSVHVSADQCAVVYALHHLEVCAVHVDSVVHHPFVQAIARSDFSLTTREMRSICLSSEITWILVAAQTYAEFFQRDILAQLCQESHTFSIMNLHVFKSCIFVVRQENTWRRSAPPSHSDCRTGHKAAVFPVWCMDQIVSHLHRALSRRTDITCIIHHTLSLFFESNTPTVTQGPTIAIGFEYRIVGDAIFHPWSGFKGDTTFGRVFHHFDLRNMRISKVYV